MFDITENKGFQITFANGWTVSVQFGRGNYGGNYSTDIKYGEPVPPTNTAEIAAWNRSDEWHDFGDDTVAGYKTPDEVLEFMNMIASK